eukprot:158940-Pleurochrysis_carterae.AAC.3
MQHRHTNPLPEYLPVHLPRRAYRSTYLPADLFASPPAKLPRIMHLANRPPACPPAYLRS